MGSENDERSTVMTQLSFGGFDTDVTAQTFTDYLEETLGVVVWRCRLKKSWTPPESYPDFTIQNSEDLASTDNYEKVELHAFVHFASPESVCCVLNAAGRCDLVWSGKPLKVSSGPENPFRINQRRRTTTPFRLSDVRLDVGNLASREDFLVAWRGPAKKADFLVDPFDGTCKFCFTRRTAFSFKGERRSAIINCNFKLEFLVREVIEVQKFTDFSGLVILLQLSSAPLVYYRTADDDIYESVPFDLLDDDDPWIRTTDFTLSGAIGRCNSYRIWIPPRNGPKLERAIKYLTQRRIPIDISRHKLVIKDEPNFGMPMSDPFFCIHHVEHVPFEVLFILNAVVHKGIINQHQLSDRFFDLLRAHTTEVNVAALRHICAYRRPLYDGLKRLKVVQDWLLKNPKLLKEPRQLADVVEVRRLIVTPTKAYCLPPEVELSNRVLRHYRNVSDRFLRVTFMDEAMQKLNSGVLSYYAAPIVKMITSNSFLQRTSAFKRVNSILKDGFYLCGRMYSFLAFSSNQLRDRSAWFFAEDKTDRKLSVNNIRNWMGRFTNKNVAKCAARMGQCFSSTYATVDVPSHEVEQCEDIKRNGYVFSDGIGIITPDLALEVAEKLQLKDQPPSAYQIRYAGCKGVIACWPKKVDGYRMYLRPSMNKFQSRHTVLEVCSWTRFQPGFLNRQIVTLLSALGVCDEIFWKRLETMLLKLDEMLVNTDVAFDVLTSSCAEQGNTAAIMLSAGFKPKTEPHLRGMLSCIRAAQLGDLREKARIFVPQGRWLMGCLDEAGVLEQGQCFIQVSTPSLENCFSKHGSRFSQTRNNLQVIKGLVIIGKNPCLHPGDIRILEAVDAEELHHLSDCLVFPQKGERPHTDEASGSDLDGDLYFVSWDEILIPPCKRSWPPMEYTPATVKELPRPVNHLDIIDFFTRNMVNENLGTICNAHVVHADLSSYGALDDKCLKLAELAALAVDFPKTGKIVTMPNELRPKMYPDFMGKPDSQSYRSEKILGRIYRRIKDAYDDDDTTTSSSGANFTHCNIPYDADLEIQGFDTFIEEAWDLKCSYVGQISGLLAQYKVRKEEEIVTGHVWSMPKYSSRKHGELKEKLKHAYNCLKKEFRQHFDRLSAEYEQLGDEEKNAVYEKKASAWYQVTYHPEWVKRSMELQGPDSEGEGDVILSFAWVPADYLARIKVRRSGRGYVDHSLKPIDSLAVYLAQRMQI